MRTLIVITALILITGCTATNPAYTPAPAGQPNTNTVPQYIPDPRIASLGATVGQIATAVSPINPYAGLTDWAIKGVFGLTGLVAGVVAGVKNKQPVIDALAAGVVKAGAAAPVLDHASTTNAYAAVANAINDNTGANQNFAGTPKV